MSESSEGGYETVVDDSSKKKGRPVARDESSDDYDDDDDHGHRRARMVTQIPRRFNCSRCAKCKYQSKVRPIRHVCC